MTDPSGRFRRDVRRRAVLQVVPRFHDGKGCDSLIHVGLLQWGDQGQRVNQTRRPVSFRAVGPSARRSPLPCSVLLFKPRLAKRPFPQT